MWQQMAHVRTLDSGDIEQEDPHGPLLRIHSRNAGSNAASLSEAIVADLHADHVEAGILGPGEPIPSSGWLITGTFYAMNAHHALTSMPLLTLGAADEIRQSILISPILRGIGRSRLPGSAKIITSMSRAAPSARTSTS